MSQNNEADVTDRWYSSSSSTEYVAISPLYMILKGRLMAAMRHDHEAAMRQSDVILLATWHSC